MKRIFPLSDFFTCFCHICRPHRVYIGEGSFARILADGQFGKLQFSGLRPINCTMQNAELMKSFRNGEKIFNGIFRYWLTR